MARTLLVAAVLAIATPATALAQDVVLSPGQQVQVAGTGLVLRDAGTGVAFGVVGSHGYFVPGTIFGLVTGSSASLDVLPSGGLGLPPLPMQALFGEPQPGNPFAAQPDLLSRIDDPKAFTSVAPAQPGASRVVVQGSGFTLYVPVNRPDANTIFLQSELYGPDAAVVPNSTLLLVSPTDARAGHVDASRQLSLVFQKNDPPTMRPSTGAAGLRRFDAVLQDWNKPLAATEQFVRSVRQGKPGLTTLATGVGRLATQVQADVAKARKLVRGANVSLGYDDPNAACIAAPPLTKEVAVTRRDGLKLVFALRSLERQTPRHFKSDVSLSDEIRRVRELLSNPLACK